MAVDHVANHEAIGWKGVLLLARRVLVVLGIGAAMLLLGWQSARYLLLGAYVDHIEGNVVISGWQFFHGAPLYATFGGAPLLATFYGPLAYLLEVPALALFGASAEASKLTSALALVLTIAAMAWHFRRHFSAVQARDALLMLLAGLLFFSPRCFWVRPDPLEALMVALALVSTRTRWSAVGIGICIGVAVNLKIHAFVYFLPLIVELWLSRGWRSLAGMAATSGTVFLLPFLAPGISLPDYAAMLAMQVGKRAPTLHTLAENTAFIEIPALLLIGALAGAAWQSIGRERVYFGSVLAALALLLYPATFPGAGLYHLLPFVPVLADAIGRVRPDNHAARWAPIALCLVAIPYGASSLVGMNALAGDEFAAGEALALARGTSAQPVQIGYGDSFRNYRASQLSKAVLSLHGYPALLDAQVLMELRYIGIDGSERWIPELANCRFGRWLLPQGEPPFAMRSFYDQGPLFDDGFRRAFLDHYRVVDRTDRFDIWACARDTAATR